MQNIISFSYLYDILIKEKVNNGLTKLEYDLFDNIEDYLKIKKEILQNAKNSNNNKKIEQIEEELKTIIDIVKQVYKTRLSKTIELAKNALEYDNINEEVLENLSKFEKEYFLSIIKIFSKQKKWLFDQFLFNEKEIETKNIDNIEKSQNIDSNINTNIENIQENKKDEENEIIEEIDLIEVIFNKDVPKFIGLDLKFKGPFKKGDKVKMDKKQTNFLLKKGIITLN
ncbi:hypothetical protein HN676_01870 [Candidatus Woesearchaeota archaeon]|nr:hypothetical protein [Candidatus Woesearchaeota archaeon]